MTETVGSGSLAQTTTNTWDALGDKLSTHDANGTTTMAYNLLGAMTSLTDPDQNQTVWTRDNLGRVISEQNPSGTETFAYDANSNLVKQAAIPADLAIGLKQRAREKPFREPVR